MNRIATSIGLLSLMMCAHFAAAQAVSPPSMKLSPDHPDGVYKTGDTVHWSAVWTASEAAPVDAKFELKSGGEKSVGDGKLQFDGKVAHFDSTFPEPNSVLVTVSWSGGKITGGAIADPYKIQPAAAEPDDFDSFWKSKLDELKTVPPNAKLIEAASDKPGVKYAKVTLDNIGGAHVEGQIANPETGGKFPAIFIPQWAGVYGLQKGWVTDRAKDGWLAMNIESHDIPIDNPPDYYNKLYGPGGALQNYWKIDNTDRDKSYYVRMYLSCVQSIEYLKSRPDWDGKTIVVMGTSQGGQQTLVTAGLMPGTITAAMPFLPAACDNWAENIGRHSGFPFWWNQVDNRDPVKVHEVSKYFDPVYFAKRIKCPVLCGCGLRDDLAPPSSVLAAYNQISSPKQIIILPLAGHMDQREQAAYQDVVYGQWLPALLKGDMPPLMPLKQ